MRRQHYCEPAADPRDQRIKVLEDKLDMARHALIMMAPYPICNDLCYPNVETRHDLRKWRRDVIAKAIEIAVPNEYGRAPCPLCGGEGDSFYARDAGYLVPGGLERHLDNHGRVTPCPVMEAAWWSAMDRNHEKFAQAEQAEREVLAHRKATERVLLTEPKGEPVVFDGYLPYLGGDRPRTPEELVNAEEQLREIGFTQEIKGNVIAYKLVSDPWLVLADPRGEGRLVFEVFKLNNQKRKHRAAGYRFYLNDAWKDLPGKFYKRLNDIIGEPKT